MNDYLLDSFSRIKSYCEKEDYKGWDPYDGLNSKVAHALLPLKHSAILRLCIIQGFKRCPVNLRPLAMVPKEHNAKGIGLFLQGYVNLYRFVSGFSVSEVSGDDDSTVPGSSVSREEYNKNLKAVGTKEEILEKIVYLSDLLLEMRSDIRFNQHPSTPAPRNKETQKQRNPETASGPEYHGACWGYNFDWQARRLFLFPAYTPTVVATNFCATALLEAYEVLKEEFSKVSGSSVSEVTVESENNKKQETKKQETLSLESIEKYKEVALSAANFVIEDLHRSEYKDGFLFSYSKLPGNDTVFNASLLGSRLLSYCYKYTGKEEYKELARKSIEACCAGQKENGAWVYGMLPVQSWVDSFHTGYNLDGLIGYAENCIPGFSVSKVSEVSGDVDEKQETKKQETEEAEFLRNKIEKGFEYYINNLFEEDGTPKYYDNKMYPIDIHCPGQLFVTLSRLHKFEEYRPLAEKVLDWTIRNMQDNKGYFYYQLKPRMSSKISYMRWSNAFMFCALSYYLLERANNSSNSSKFK